METLTQADKLSAAQYNKYFENGVTYTQYREAMAADILAQAAHKLNFQYYAMNMQRMVRIDKTVQLTHEMQQAISALQQKQNWLVISEPWCGDASQILPVLHAIALASNGKIELRIAYRDENLELMDAHLTGTSRSIPKLIILNEHFEPVTEWGPRPAEAQKLVKTLKADPATAPTYSEHLHKWYALDKTLSTQAELAGLVALPGDSA